MKNSQFKLVVLLQVATLFLVGMLFFHKPSLNNSERRLLGQSAKAIEAGSCNDEKPERKNISYDNRFVYGDDNAPNELVVFTRYSCHYCKLFYQEAFTYLQNNDIKEGKLKVIFIENTNPLDKIEILMVKSAEIGREVNLYESMQETFYSNEFYPDSLAVVNFLIEGGIKSELIADKLNSDSINEDISRQLSEGERLEIKGTPTFFLNGYPLVGYTGQKDFLAFLETFYNTN